MSIVDSRSSTGNMPTDLSDTLFEVPGEILYRSIRLSIILALIISAFCDVMSTLTYIGILLALILAFIYRFSLPKRDPAQIESILGSKAGLFGHRAAALDAPENTMSAIRLAKKNRGYGVEIDLSFTKDNVAIVFHDDDLDRTTDGRGPVLDTTWEKIQDLDASVSHIYSDRFKNERVPTIDEAVKEALGLGLKIILDIKEHDERAVNFLVDLFDKYPTLKNEALVGSFYPQLVYKLRSRRPDIVTAFIWRRNFLAYNDVEATKPRYADSPIKQCLAGLLDPVLDWCIHNFLWHMAGVSAVSVHKDHISRDYVDYWTARNIKVISWTANNPIEKDFFLHLNVSVITDTLV